MCKQGRWPPIFEMGYASRHVKCSYLAGASKISTAIEMMMYIHYLKKNQMSTPAFNAGQSTVACLWAISRPSIPTKAVCRMQCFEKSGAAWPQDKQMDESVQKQRVVDPWVWAHRLDKLHQLISCPSREIWRGEVVRQNESTACKHPMSSICRLSMETWATQKPLPICLFRYGYIVSMLRGHSSSNWMTDMNMVG